MKVKIKKSAQQSDFILFGDHIQDIALFSNADNVVLSPFENVLIRWFKIHMINFPKLLIE
jgi:hypothetical protein